MLLDDTEGVLAGFYRSAAHFLDAQGPHGPVTVLDHSENEDAGGKKFFNPVGEIVVGPRRKVRSDEVGGGEI